MYFLRWEKEKGGSGRERKEGGGREIEVEIYPSGKQIKNALYIMYFVNLWEGGEIDSRKRKWGKWVRQKLLSPPWSEGPWPRTKTQPCSPLPLPGGRHVAISFLELTQCVCIRLSRPLYPANKHRRERLSTLLFSPSRRHRHILHGILKLLSGSRLHGHTCSLATKELWGCSTLLFST